MKLSSDYYSDWRPEDNEFWESTGKRIAWRTLWITTFSLTLSFATWFMMSGIVVRLPGIGFDFSEGQLFWLTAMPGLAGGTLRLVHMFLVPIFGTRKVITIATFAKLLPCIGLGFAVLTPDTPYWIFLLLAFLCGLGGGDFSSFMPSTSVHFPKRLQGTALGIQAGIGNFGVTVTQLVTPWIIGFALAGGVLGGSQTLTGDAATRDIWLQNAALWMVPFLLALGFVSWRWLRSVPVNASFKEQLDIFGNKHTWYCTLTYIMTFGVFSGLAAVFPLMISTLFGEFENAPDPLKYAFYGPLIGSCVRVMWGPLTDKYGGAIWTQICGIGLVLCCAVLVFGGFLEPENLDDFRVFVGVMFLVFFFSGIGNASTFRQFPVIFSHSARQAAGVIGFTAAIAAYAPFVVSILMAGAVISFGSYVPFFMFLMIYCVFATGVNWWFYARKGAERPS